MKNVDITRPEFQTMSRDTQTAYLAALLNKPIRYAERAEVERGLNLFGPNFPIQWKESTLYALREYKGDRAIGVDGPLQFFSDPRMNMRLLLIDELWDVQPVEEVQAPAPEEVTAGRENWTPARQLAHDLGFNDEDDAAIASILADEVLRLRDKLQDLAHLAIAVITADTPRGDLVYKANTILRELDDSTSS